MNANLARTLGAVALAAAFATWVAFQLHWETVNVPVPAKGEALTNPYYALERFAAGLGVHTREISTVRGLQPEAVLILVEPGDQLTRPPVAVLESWVEAGGRLVITSVLLNSYPALRAWSGIKAARPMPVAPDAKPTPSSKPRPRSSIDSGDDCPLMQVRADGALTGQSFRVCDWFMTLTFDAERPPAWSLSDDRGMHVIRTGVGFGEITVLEPHGVLNNELLKRADHAEMFATAAGLRHDDTLLIFHPASAVALPLLLWRLVAPAILFLAAALLALAWRHAPRFGPPLPALTPLRRSLAEQIRANARFAWRTRNLGGLRTSARRSLDETATRHIVGYAGLDASQKAERLAELTGLDSTAIRAAREEAAAPRLNEERAAITLMEVCRRILLRMHTDHRRPII